MGDDTAERKMIPISLGEFLNGMVSPANLYLKLSSGKRVLLFKTGANFDHKRLKKYQDKDVQHLWVYAEDFKDFCNSAVGIANTGVSQEFLSTSKKAFLVSNATQTIYRGFEEIGLDISGYETAAKSTEAVLEIAGSDFDINTLIGMLYEADNYLSSHSVATAILAPAIGQAMGLETLKSLKKLALGGLLHDIGKLHIPPELLSKPINVMSHEDLREYQMHSQLGAEMMKALKLNSEDLTKIVFQHHERNDGSGYPLRLKSHKIHPLAKLVGAASEFLNLVMPNPRFNSNVYTTHEALKFIQGGLGMPYDKMTADALEKVVLGNNDETLTEAA